jgi:hypothetical protein
MQRDHKIAALAIIIALNAGALAQALENAGDALRGNIIAVDQIGRGRRYYSDSHLQVRKPAQTSRRSGVKKLRQLLRINRARVAQQPPRKTLCVPNQGCEYSL